MLGTKHYLRELLGDNWLHSSSCLNEFFLQGILLLHPTFFKKIVTPPQEKNWNGQIDILEQDLVGARGWTSIEECMELANLCSDYVVLRNFEYLPHNFWGNDSDIDLLCNDLGSIRSVLNAIKRGHGISSYVIKVKGRPVPLDIRFLGDNYYDSLWQRDMLRKKKYHNKIVPRLSDEDYFFSLLYHCKLQKVNVKAKYIPILIATGRIIGLTITEDDIINDEAAAQIINGYLKGSGYTFTSPIDRGVHLNKNVYKYITELGRFRRGFARGMLSELIKKTYYVVPSQIKKLIPSSTKAFFRKI